MTGYGAIVLGDPEHEVTICVCSNFRGSEELGMGKLAGPVAGGVREPSRTPLRVERAGS